MAATKRAKTEAPWNREAPRGARHRKLTAAEKRSATRAAEEAGRRYPNLVDNMRTASRKK